MTNTEAAATVMIDDATDEVLFCEGCDELLPAETDLTETDEGLLCEHCR